MTSQVNNTDDMEIGSDRSFGIVFAIVFLVIGLFPLWSGASVRIWALVIAAAFLLTALIYPSILRPLNRVWYRIGLLMHRVVNPVIMGLIFFGAVMPTGLLMRLCGKDPLRLRIDPQAESYWIPRDPPGPASDSMRNQF